MKKYDTVVFDLDGTLTNPERGQILGFEYAMKKHNIKYPERSWLKKYIGPSLHLEWKKEFSLSDDEVVEMIDTYREFYNIYGWWDNEVYPGIREMLAELKKTGKRLLVATGKPEAIARKILSRFCLDEYFDFIGGATEDKERYLKCQILDYSLESVGADKASAILVGDRIYDAEGARISGVDAMGVSWGHGSPDELESAGFIYIAKAPYEVVDYIKNRI